MYRSDPTETTKEADMTNRLLVSAAVAIFAMVSLPASAELPTVLLIGDSIREGYAPLVAKKLEGVAVVRSPKQNCGDTAMTQASIDVWLAESKPLIVHWNNGLHDLKRSKKTSLYQVPIPDYSANLKIVAGAIRKVTPHVLFATTTPIVDERHTATDAAFNWFDKDVRAYNEKAAGTLLPLGIVIHDLNRIVHDGDPVKLLDKDGAHFTPEGYERLADAVADSIRRKLAILSPTVLKAPASGPDAVAAYRKAEAEQDALVPEIYKTLPFPTFGIPADKDAWAKRRPDVKAKVVASLGDLPPRPAIPGARLVSVERHPGFRLERLRIFNGIDGTMSTMMLIPDGVTKPAPTIFWQHSSSFHHPQLLTPNMNGGAEPLGITFVKRGWVVFAADAAWYGERGGQGPSGTSEVTVNQQASQMKYNLLFGRTLWGMFVRDDLVALDYLCTRSEVDVRHIGTTGISMGSTRSWWLAAVDDRIACAVGVACLTRHENLIKHGQLRQHGVYYFVDGLLKHFDTEGVISLIAPKPVLFLTGELDPGSPADGIRTIEEKAGGTYRALGAADRFRSIRYPDIGHTYTPTMRKEMLDWFDRWMK